MKYKSPKQHNNVVQTMLEEAIKKIMKTKHESDVNMLTEVLDYHQQINDKEIKRRFYEDFTEMQQELPVIHVDSDLLSIIAKHVTQYGFALTHGPDGEYMSTALLHKAGYKVSTEVKNGLNAKRTNVINMLSLAIQDENLTEIEQTEVEHKNTFVEDTSLKQQFMEAVEFAIGNGYDIHYKFGEAANTLEHMFTIMLRWQANGDAGYDACIKAYNSAFYNHDTGRYDNKGRDGEYTEVEEYSDNEETPDIATQFINAIGYATKHGETKDYKFGARQYTLEEAYENSLDMQEHGSVKYDDCIQVYEWEFYEDVFKKAIEKALKDGSGIKHRFGIAKDTLEDVYKSMIRRQDEGSDECDTCIQAYREAFINNKEE